MNCKICIRFLCHSDDSRSEEEESAIGRRRCSAVQERFLAQKPRFGMTKESLIFVALFRFSLDFQTPQLKMKNMYYARY
jgi:hypothetical protein